VTQDETEALQVLLETKLDHVGDLIADTRTQLEEGHRSLERHLDSRLGRIETQVTKTNGRVTELELWKVREAAKSDVYLSARSWVQPVITGCITAIVVLGITILITGTI
jgi:hypothetical protein